ncbi:hypothetical protein QQ045_008984 [Rhodiola kirilowii]
MRRKRTSRILKNISSSTNHTVHSFSFTSLAAVFVEYHPAHQEIGMPSLSPIMTEDNIARWLKKKCDKVSSVCGDGAKEIKVGEDIAISVEDEDEAEIAKFKGYTPQKSAHASAPAAE